MLTVWNDFDPLTEIYVVDTKGVIAKHWYYLNEAMKYLPPAPER